MIPTLVISATSFVGITLSILFFPHIKIKRAVVDTYWIVALIVAFILLAFAFVPIQEVFKELTSDSDINPLKILVLFFSMTVISIYLDEIGLFRFLAGVAIKRAKSSQYVLFFILYVLTSILTVFTSNDVVILTLTPFICFFCKNAKINPLPYLIAEFAAANTWSMMFVIGNPTNIYLATSAHITFIEYFKVMWLPTVISGLVQLLLIFLIFFKKLKEQITIEEDDYKIESKFDLIVGLVILLAVLTFLVISNYINLQMWMIALVGASTLLIISVVTRLITKKNWHYVKGSLVRLPYQLIPFVLSMFVIVTALKYQGISTKIGEIINQEPVIWIYGSSSFLFSNVINNIPMSILFSSLPTGLEGVAYSRAIYASIIGSNVGAFFTPIGALAGIMFSSLVNKHDIKFSFLDFTKYGVLIAIPTLAVSLGILTIIL